MAGEQLADLPAEEMILGAMMLSERAIDAVTDEGLKATDFYRASHGVVFDAAVALYAEASPVEPRTVIAKLAALGQMEAPITEDRIVEIATLAPVTTTARHWARIVIELSVRRALAAAGKLIEQRANDREGSSQDALAAAEQAVFDVAEARRRGGSTVTLRSALDDAYVRLEAAHERGRAVTGLATEFEHLDALTSGLQPGNLVVVAARPSLGKSAFALAVALNAVRRQEPVAFFTLEMSQAEVADRVICAEALVENRSLRNGTLDAEEWTRVVNTTAEFRELPLLIEPDTSVTALELRSRARRLKMRYPTLSLVVVDYLQLMTSGLKAENRTQDVSQISRALKVLAGDLDVPVIAVSQLSRQVESRHDKRPELRDLRESGQIEADADLVVMLYRDEVYNQEDADELGTAGVCEVILAKHRNGPLGTVRLAFVKKYAKFATLVS